MRRFVFFFAAVMNLLLVDQAVKAAATSAVSVLTVRDVLISKAVRAAAISAVNAVRTAVVGDLAVWAAVSRLSRLLQT